MKASIKAAFPLRRRRQDTGQRAEDRMLPPRLVFLQGRPLPVQRCQRGFHHLVPGKQLRHRGRLLHLHLAERVEIDFGFGQHIGDGLLFQRLGKIRHRLLRCALGHVISGPRFRIGLGAGQRDLGKIRQIFRARKDAVERVEIRRRNRVEFVIVTARASHGQSHQSATDNIDPVIDDLVVLLKKARPHRQVTERRQCGILGF